MSGSTIVYWVEERLRQGSVEQSQRIIYNYFLDVVKRATPGRVLKDFQALFLHLDLPHGHRVQQALQDLVASYNEQEFRYTLQRCCYILVNNWTVSGHTDFIVPLIDVFSPSLLRKTSSSLKLNTLRTWVYNFVKSDAFEALRLFCSHHVPELFAELHIAPWSKRFSVYFLAAQYSSAQSSQEQRQAAATLIGTIKREFRQNLALFTARQGERAVDPTGLGSQALDLVQQMLERRGDRNYQAVAERFLDHVSELSFWDFKVELMNYLDFADDDPTLSEVAQTLMWSAIADLQSGHHDRPVTAILVIKTCKRLISCLTTEEKPKPSELFTTLLHQSDPLNLVVLLLKLALLCTVTHTYLESCLAELLRYYSDFDEGQCGAFIQLMNLITLAANIYSDETRYNLVALDPFNSSVREKRIFSQARC
jgi:hypothetical protein